MLKIANNDLVKLRRTRGTLKNGNWLLIDTGTDSRETGFWGDPIWTFLFGSLFY
jgi:hypothetical protein